MLVINGRTSEKIEKGKEWLDHLRKKEKPPSIIIVMLGNEKCENEWIEEYVYDKSQFIKAVLLTYDDFRVDGMFYFQWPLGVATYRYFPNLKRDKTRTFKSRKYICNFQATVYENSSRSVLIDELNKISSKDKCYIKPRKVWASKETPESMNDYIWNLVQSDITLCPTGFNAETYRVYEALAAGSVPVIENVPGKGYCDVNPWRILKKYKPPVIWVKDWNSIHEIIEAEESMTVGEKVIRRRKLAQWYYSFKLKLKKKFFQIIKQKLLMLS